MKFLLHNEENITFPAIRPAYQEGELYFDRFRMLTPRDAKDSIIGEGGTGIIHLVRDELLDRIVALKLPHESILRDPGARFDVIRETRQAIELTHPNIVRIHDFHESRRNWGISMQYVRGRNLDEWRHVGSTGTRRTIVTYDVERITAWISQLCDALIYAHEEAHMVHRDIKPKNLMLERWEDGHERLLLTDFGITQKLRMHTMMLSRVQSRTDGKGTMGTLPYMSMQQIHGESASIFDDIYAVGATIYELLTGRPPFYEGSYAQIRTQVETVVPPGMNQRLQDFDIPAREIPDIWEDAVSACLAKKTGDRPPSIRDLRSRLGLGGAAAPATEDIHLREEIIIISKALEERGQAVSAMEAELDTLRRTIAEITPTDIPAGEWQGAYQDLKANFDATRFLLDAAMGERDAFHDSLAATRQSHAELLQTHTLLEHEVNHLREMFAAGDTGNEAHQQAWEQAELRAAAAESDARARIQQVENDARATINATQEEASARIRQIEEHAEQRTASAENEALARIQQAEDSAQARIHALEEEASVKLRQAEEAAGLRVATVESEAAARLQEAENSAQARIDAIQKETSEKIRQVEEAAGQRAATAESEATARIQQAESSLQAKIDAIQEEAAARIRQAEQSSDQRAAAAENEALTRIRQTEDSIQARIDAIQEEAAAKARQAEQSGEQRTATVESEAAARIQQAEDSLQAKIDAIQNEASAKIRQAEEGAQQRAIAAESGAAARIQQAEGSLQTRIDAIQEEASAKIRQAEESAGQRTTAAESECAARIQQTETSTQARIDAIQEEASAKARQAEESARQRITAAESEAASRISGKMEELEETGRLLRLKAARPLAEALAKLEAANQQLASLRADHPTGTAREA